MNSVPQLICHCHHLLSHCLFPLWSIIKHLVLLVLLHFCTSFVANLHRLCLIGWVCRLRTSSPSRIVPWHAIPFFLPYSSSTGRKSTWLHFCSLVTETPATLLVYFLQTAELYKWAGLGYGDDHYPARYWACSMEELTDSSPSDEWEEEVSMYGMERQIWRAIFTVDTVDTL